MKRTPAAEALAKRVQELRTRRGLTAQQLADGCAAAGAPALTRSAIAKIETVNRSVSEPELAVLAEQLGVSVAVLHGDAPAVAGGRPPPLFISYAAADETWAGWIAWTLEAAGYAVTLAAWDLEPGADPTAFAARAVGAAAAVLAVVSPGYLAALAGQAELAVAVDAAGDRLAARLIPVRVAPGQLPGPLADVRAVDLVGVPDPDQARALLLDRVARAIGPPAGAVDGPGPAPAGGRLRRPAAPPPYAGADPGGPRAAVTVLHLPAPRLGGPGAAATAADLQARVWAEVVRMTDAGAPPPDLLVVTGGLTWSGRRGEFDQALAFLTGLRVQLGLEPRRVVVVPGPGEVSDAACEAYFLACAADEVEPVPPYWPKWRHYARLVEHLYRGLDDVVFAADQPWTLYRVPELGVALAGLNSTMAYSHRPADRFGWVGDRQAAWFANELRPYEAGGWLRIGVVAHAPVPADPADPTGAGLRDGDAVDRLLAPRLNLVLHGEPAARGGAGAAAVGPPDLARTGRLQLLQITPDGVRADADADADADDQPGAAGAGGPRVLLRRRWVAVEHTFGPAAEPAGDTAGPDRPRGAAGVAEAADLEPHADPVATLLDNIAEVSRTRSPGAQVRAGAGDFPHLVVSTVVDGVVERTRVGAHVGPMTAQVLARFVHTVHDTDRSTFSELVYDGPPAPGRLRADAQRQGVRLRSFPEFQGLLDLRGYVARQTERLGADPAYPPGWYVPQRFRELVGGAGGVQDDLAGTLTDLLTRDEGRFVLLLGEFGAGKTFALREVARRLAGYPHLTPLYIELRALDKAHSVDGLVATHLASHGIDTINLAAFRYLLREGRIVLLFDGFDELVTRVTYDRAADHLSRLVAAADGKAKIVVAGRTQHFQTSQQVLTALGVEVGLLPHRRVLSVEPFDPGQIRAYLVGRYGGDERSADGRLSDLQAVSSLSALARNPRMLGFLAGLDGSRLRAAGADPAVGAAWLYEEILRSWLSYEQRRTDEVAGAPPGLPVADLWQAVTALAVRLWLAGESFLGPADLAEVAAALPGAAAGRLSAAQAVHTVGAGSLLTRSDDGRLGFLDPSVVEWLVARAVAEEWAAGGSAARLLAGRPLPELAVEFLCGLADPAVAIRWAKSVLGDAGSGDTARANALRIAGHLRTRPRADLKGVSLRGEDLSARDLGDTNLAGADLTDARLIGTDLTDAVLAGARLVGARLDRAVLTRADLTGADLHRARLLGTDLTAVRTASSRWGRAVLVAARGVAALTGRPELAGAAVAPGQPVEFGLRPAAVGVSYGFQPGRLPQPLAYHPDGDLLAVGGDDGTVLVCAGPAGHPVRTLTGHRGRVYGVHFTADGRRLVTGGSDGTVLVRDAVGGGALLHVLDGHRDWVWPIVPSPDGTLLATGDRSGVVRLWDLVAGRLRHELPGHAEPVWTAAFDPAGAVLAVGDSGGRVRLWDVATGQPGRTLDHGAEAVYRIEFCPDGSVLGAADATGAVRLWDPATGRLVRVLAGHRRPVYALDFTRSGLLATGDTGGEVRLWDLSGADAGPLTEPLTGPLTGPLTDPPTDPPAGRVLTTHSGAVYGVCFSPDGSLLATGDSDGTVRLWDTAGPTRRHEIAAHRGAVRALVFRPDGRHLATSGADGSMAVWDTASAARRTAQRGHGRRLTSVRFSADGRLLATAGNDGAVRLWDPATGRLRRRLAPAGGSLVSADFSPTEPVLATACADGRVLLWNTETWMDDRELSTGTEHVWAAAFSPDGDVLATAADDDSVQLWFWKTGREVHTLTGHRGRVRSIAFSPAGGLVATGCDDALVRLWSRQTGELVETLRGHRDRVYAVRFSPDGHGLLSASHDGTGRLWRLPGTPAGKPAAHVLRGPGGRLWDAAVSPDGALLATGGDDLAVRLWDGSGRRELAALTGHTGRIRSLSVSPDGSAVAAGGDDGTVRLWRLGAGGYRPAATLLGLPGADWAALTPDGRYKTGGDAAGEVWHVVGLCRLELGELDPYLPDIRRVPDDEPL